MIKLLIEEDAYDGVKDKFDIIFDFQLRILSRRKRISLPLASISSNTGTPFSYPNPNLFCAALIF